MRRGWEVVLDDGTTITEEECPNWNKVPKKRIVSLILRYEGREWVIEGKDAYLQKKRGSMSPFIKDDFIIESRSIGYYEGKSKVWYTVHEDSGAMKLEVETIK